MNLTLGTIDLDDLDVDELRAHAATLERGLRVVRGLIDVLDTPELEPLALPPAEPEPELDVPVGRPRKPCEIARAGQRPAGSPPGESSLVIAARNRQTIAAYFDARPGHWIARRALVDETGVGESSVNRILATMVAAGDVEKNGRLRSATRYRKAVRAIEAPPPDPRPAEPILTADQAAAKIRAQDAPAPAARPETPPQPPPPISPRVRKLLSTETAPKPTPVDEVRGTVQGRVLLALAHQQATMPELANRLSIPAADIALALRSLDDEGELSRAGRRNGNVVYSAVRPV